jgi:hypothetical protein
MQAGQPMMTPTSSHVAQAGWHPQKPPLFFFASPSRVVVDHMARAVCMQLELQGSQHLLAPGAIEVYNSPPRPAPL